VRFPYREGQTRIDAPGELILPLPAGGYNNRWTRNIIASLDGQKLYVSVGSASNVGEHGMDEEIRRANILEINPDGSGEKVFASGLRKPNGMDWEPETGALWTAVNERDGLGDDLVPDYITRVRDGGFYGWPYSYYGQNEDPRRAGERPDLVARAIAPDFALGSHTASLGLVFYGGDSFPERYRGGAFIGQHGSWNRAEFSGYQVVFVPFAGGRPSGDAEDFLTGSWRTRRGEKPMAGRSVSRCCQTAPCSWPTMPVTRSGASKPANDDGPRPLTLSSARPRRRSLVVAGPAGGPRAALGPRLSSQHPPQFVWFVRP
jgi:glucose/arabinose dehydrogenase